MKKEMSALEVARGTELVKQLCELYGGRFVSEGAGSDGIRNERSLTSLADRGTTKKEEFLPFFPQGKYVYLAMWLRTEQGRRWYRLNQCSMGEFVLELSRFVGWEVEAKPLSNALARLAKSEIIK